MQPGQPHRPNLTVGAAQAVGFGCALAMASLLYVAGHLPLASWRTSLVERADVARGKLADGPRVRQEHAEMQEQLRALLAKVEEVNRRVPETPNEGEFLSDLTRLAEAAGVKIDDFRRGEVSPGATHSVVNVTVKGAASHAGLVALVDGVARAPRLASLTQLRVEASAPDEPHPVELQYALHYGLTTSE